MTTEERVKNYISTGEGLLGYGKIKEAEEPFKKAVELSPSNWRGWYGLAQIDLHSITVDSVKKINFENLCKAYNLAGGCKAEVEEFLLNKVKKFAEDTIYHCDFMLLIDRIPKKLHNYDVKDIVKKKGESSISRSAEEKFGANARKRVLKELEVVAEKNQDLKVLYDILKEDRERTLSMVKSERSFGDSWVTPMLEEYNGLQKTIISAKSWAKIFTKYFKNIRKKGKDHDKSLKYLRDTLPHLMTEAKYSICFRETFIKALNKKTNKVIAHWFKRVIIDTLDEWKELY